MNLNCVSRAVLLSILGVAVGGMTLGLTGCDRMKSLMNSDGAAPDAASLAAQKFAAYGKAQDDVASLHPFAQEILQYDEYNPAIRGKAPLDAYSAVTNPFGSGIHLLRQAMDIKADLGPLDTSAARLLAAMTALNPTVKAMRAYADSELVHTDNGAKGRELDPVYRAQMKEALDADREFGSLLSAKGMELDTARLKTMQPDTIEYNVLNTDVASRRALDALGALNSAVTPETQAAFVAALPPVDAANKALATALTQYKGTMPMDHCKSYQSQAAKLVASGNDTAGSPLTKVRHGTKAERFISDYNDSVTAASACFADLHSQPHL
jgi:hypothetical protein